MARTNNKRKRESLSQTANGDSSHLHESTPDTTSTTPSVALDESPFRIDWVKNTGTPKKRARTGKREDVSEEKEEEGIPGADLGGLYTVVPGTHWNSLRKYRNFVVNPNNEPKDDAKHKFEVGEFVFVNHSETPAAIVTNDKDSWIAQVREVRAPGPHAVYVRVIWMYWPEELPNGREDYHGENELIASNFHQVIDAMTVSGKARVYHLADVHDILSLPVDALYWRQKLDIRKARPQPSTLPKECVCKKVSCPDKMEARCPNPACGQWQHEDCLMDAVLRRYWDERQSKLVGAKSTGPVSEDSRDQSDREDSGIEDTIIAAPKSRLSSIASNFGRIVVDTLTRGSSKSNGSARANGATTNKAPTAKKKGKKGRRVSKAVEEDKPWEGTLDAKMQTERNSEGKPEFTGKATIYRVTRKNGETILEDFDELEVECLFCNQSMVEAEEVEQEIEEPEPDPNIDPSLLVSPAALASSKSAGSNKSKYDAVHEAAAENALSGDDQSSNGKDTKRDGAPRPVWQIIQETKEDDSD